MIRLALSLAVLGGLAVRSRAETEFVGILVTSQGTRFALGDTATGRTEWIAPGESFGGDVIKSFDAKADTLVFVRDGVERRLRLKDEGKVAPSRLELRGAITFGTAEKVEIERATLLLGQENVFSLRNGLTYRITPERRDNGTVRYAITVERLLGENRSERISAPVITAQLGQPFRIQIEDLEFSFTPRPP